MHSNATQVTATYRDSQGQPRCASLLVPLPLCLFATVVPPVRNAEFNLMISTNRDPPQMVDIFQDMLVQVGMGTDRHGND